MVEIPPSLTHPPTPSPGLVAFFPFSFAFCYSKSLYIAEVIVIHVVAFKCVLGTAIQRSCDSQQNIIHQMSFLSAVFGH